MTFPSIISYLREFQEDCIQDDHLAPYKYDVIGSVNTLS